MNQTNWKLQYSKLAEQQSKQQSRAASIEKLLRHAVIKLAQTGEGVSQKLDPVLKELQKAARKGDAVEVKKAILHLDSLMVAFEKEKIAESSHDKARFLVALLQKMQLSPEQRSQVKDILIELLRHCATGLESEGVQSSLDQLAKLLGERVKLDQWQSIETLIDLLQFPPGSEDTLQHLREMARAQEAETLTALSQFINETGGSAAQGIEPILHLLDEISVMPGMSEGIERIKNKAENSAGAVDWNSLLDELAHEIQHTILENSQEKIELESFISSVSEELQGISSLIQVQQKDSDHTGEFQSLMDTNVNLMEEQMSMADSFEGLKEGLAKNLSSIRKGVENYVEEERQRQQDVDENQQQLRQRINQMELETTQLKIKLNENREKLLKDTLTGVNSRMAYDERMTHEYAQWKRYGGEVSYALLDIDHFKRINDSFGHNAGDKALTLIARSIEQAIRETDFMARIGGEEFVAIFPGTELAQAQKVAEKVRQAVQDCEFHYKGEKVAITISIGLTCLSEGDLPKTVYERADRNLYQAKASGRNRVVVDER